MNRSQRRVNKAKWNRDVRKFHAQSPIFEMHILRKGFPQSRENLARIHQWIALLASGEPCQCLFCDHRFVVLGELPPAFFMMIPRVENPIGGLMSGICSKCADRPTNELLELAHNYLKATIAPDSRCINEANYFDEPIKGQ